MIDIEEKHLIEIRHILNELAPDYEVRVFGSRVDGTAKKFSDIDLALVGSEKLNFRKIGRLKDAFASSNIPMTVDIIDYNAVSKEFQAIIDKQYEVIQQKSCERNSDADESQT